VVYEKPIIHAEKYTIMKLLEFCGE